jgi:predicted dienelactone hydrolase
VVPAYLREQMRLDAKPVLDLRDDRVRAAFAMAPGDIQGFGMDQAGLRQMASPAYIIVGAGDTATPPKENAEFAAKYIPHAQLDVLPGQVSHEIFDNECDQLGRDNCPESCIDAPGVDRAKLHEYIGNAALKFFDTNLGVRRELELRTEREHQYDSPLEPAYLRNGTTEREEARPTRGRRPSERIPMAKLDRLSEIPRVLVRTPCGG